MKLIDLIKMADETKVLEYLAKVDDIKYQEKYIMLFQKLKSLKPTSNCDLKIFIVKQKDYLDEVIHLKVLGNKENDDERYALDFVPWSDWVGCEVVEKSVYLYGLVPFVGECLYEMSFISFEEGVIQQELETLKEIEDRIKSGEEKTYTMEEVIQHLNNEFDLNIETKEKSEEELEQRRKETESILAYNRERIDEILNK